ncbi:MAG: DPP IV N-terminal domain-containing protein [Cytophagales bacterium]|nr:DPP IV N-terminal domain-containing protein [Cytophagales bacterium]
MTIDKGEIVKTTLPGSTRTTVVTKADLTPVGLPALNVRSFTYSNDQSQILLFVNSVRVWRLETRGDYWILNLATKKIQQIGRDKPASSLMFAKFSPDGTRVAYVSQQNVYVEDVATGQTTALTADGNRKLIYGTFDWVYEEEFGCRDGFQWSPDGKSIAYWQIDATKIRDYYMINNTDSAYSRIIPVEYPNIGETPSPARIAVANLETGKKTWLDIPGDPQQHYLPRMEWNSSTELYVQQLNRKQQESKLFVCNPATGAAKMIYTERDNAWVDMYSFAAPGGRSLRHFILWLNNQKEFLWMSEKDGWTHLYRVSKDGSKETLITRGDYDVIDFLAMDEKSNLVYFTASPANATQRYLFKTKLDGSGKAERVSPMNQQGTHEYSISPTGKFAKHTFSNASTATLDELIDLPKNKPLSISESIDAKLKPAPTGAVEFFTIKTAEGVTMDGWMMKPKGFDSSKKYPVVFQVYTEPAGQTVLDRFGTGRNRLYRGDMAEDGYIYMSIDGRGTPAPKGREWRKSIYRNIGRININDQAQAAKEILTWPFVDAERIAVWGWSGGGSATLNLLFQYPDIYKTGIAIAAVANQLTYDNIYQERYMGLPQENLEDIVKGSPVTYAKNLKGNLLYIHGTGDDNVHYNNAEMLLNELIKHNKQFQFMAYPNRSHGISEGEGTTVHLSTLFTNYLKTHCPPGGR